MDAERAYKEYESESVVKKDNQVNNQLSMIGKALTEQDHLIHLLMTKLEPVAIPESDDDKTTATPQDVLVPLATDLRIYQQHVFRNNERLEDLISRIQL